jgi:hypothetical protein
MSRSGGERVIPASILSIYCWSVRRKRGTPPPGSIKLFNQLHGLVIRAWRNCLREWAAWKGPDENGFIGGRQPVYAGGLATQAFISNTHTHAFGHVRLSAEGKEGEPKTLSASTSLHQTRTTGDLGPARTFQHTMTRV